MVAFEIGFLDAFSSGPGVVSTEKTALSSKASFSSPFLDLGTLGGIFSGGLAVGSAGVTGAGAGGAVVLDGEGGEGSPNIPRSLSVTGAEEPADVFDADETSLRGEVGIGTCNPFSFDGETGTDGTACAADSGSKA